MGLSPPITDRALPEITSLTADGLEQAIGDARPLVWRGAAKHWPAVAAGRQSPAGLRDYLSSLSNESKVQSFVAEPTVGGRYFFDHGLDQFNFEVIETSLNRLLLTLDDIDRKQHGHTVYMGSTPTRAIMPRFAAENPMPVLANKPTEPRAWIGNSSRIAPHYDEADNIAVVVSGRRRFTLFPPEQVRNLYVGPIDRTVAGQPTSIVDVAAPDLERFPLFREAIDSAMAAELDPGDAIFIPSLWWHAVESDGPLNLLVNYWWADGPPDAGSPMHAIVHGLLTISHLPADKRKAWREMYDHFVFRLDSDPVAHIPENSRSILGQTSETLRRRIRHYLMNVLRALDR
ncbi:cupin-like domain-containing protein [Sphingomonas rhizophila]|uniref:Cupin-like domain-containing protein n=1 Tax=Sphingomonas rhizophila TaxID=2071607 RepID=A0A7G9SBC2_9SPHN|nr:cupin-like domain-containing protein [Sphingomonas rhizophila]QNN65147.1 cupin-like domain-containing protein [Sphingomonas rhizophila]